MVFYLINGYCIHDRCGNEPGTLNLGAENHFPGGFSVLCASEIVIAQQTKKSVLLRRFKVSRYWTGASRRNHHSPLVSLLIIAGSHSLGGTIPTLGACRFVGAVESRHRFS